MKYLKLRIHGRTVKQVVRPIRNSSTVGCSSRKSALTTLEHAVCIVRQKKSQSTNNSSLEREQNCIHNKSTKMTFSVVTKHYALTSNSELST